MELAGHRTRLREEVFQVEGVVSLGVRESANRVNIGVSDPAAASEVLDLLERMGIPIEAVVIDVGVSVREAALTLTDDEPSGKVQGGWQIRAKGATYCTLGFPAIRRSNNDTVFVTNSHCTDDEASLDYGVVGQNYWTDSIGHEVSDPAPVTCWPHTCVDADAALYDVEFATFDLGAIARTEASSGCDYCNATLNVDTANPTIEILGRYDHTIENETLHKVGRTTGWTYGAVESTCDDYFGGGSVKKLCSDRVDFSVKGGDSGSPVFEYAGGSSGSAELRGIVWGSWSNGLGDHDGLMFDLYQVEEHLGGLVTFDPGGPSVSVSGPSSIGEDLYCTWSANVSDGITPFTYEWTGILTGTGSDVSGVPSNSGWLTVEVEDWMGRTDTYSHYVTVSSGGPTPPGCSE